MSPERFERVAVLGGIYSNHIALEAAIADARKRDVEAIFCLGDLGAFGPSPDKTFPILLEAGVRVMQGNYDNSISRGLSDCQCRLYRSQRQRLREDLLRLHVRAHLGSMEGVDA